MCKRNIGIIGRKRNQYKEIEDKKIKHFNLQGLSNFKNEFKAIDFTDLNLKEDQTQHNDNHSERKLKYDQDLSEAILKYFLCEKRRDLFEN